MEELKKSLENFSGRVKEEFEINQEIKKDLAELQSRMFNRRRACQQ